MLLVTLVVALLIVEDVPKNDFIVISEGACGKDAIKVVKVSSKDIAKCGGGLT